jgi:DNA-binding NarL/FixJ family response regulator
LNSNGNKGIRILIVDDHFAMRRGLRLIIESHAGWRVCGEAADGLEAIERAKELKPDIILMDVSMPKMNGLEATFQIIQLLPKTEVLILSLFDASELVNGAKEAGAHGYISKAAPENELITAVQNLAEHKSSF